MLEIGKPGFEVLSQSDTVSVLRTSPTIQLKVNAAGSLGTAHQVKLTYEAEAPVSFPPVQEEQFAPVADTFVWDGAKANTNFGSSTYLVARNGGGGFKRQTFFKFDLGGCTGEVNAAKLWVYGSTDQPGGVSAFAVADDSWTESEVTWNRKPALGQKLDTASFDTAAGWKALDVTSFVQSELSGNGIVSIGIDTVDNRYASMNSREAAEDRPYLQVLFPAAVEDALSGVTETAARKITIRRKSMQISSRGAACFSRALGRSNELGRGIERLDVYLSCFWGINRVCEFWLSGIYCTYNLI
ncbi:DNRLRE domain-containing protein [Paenibacillus melissococcoides]